MEVVLIVWPREGETEWLIEFSHLTSFFGSMHGKHSLAAAPSPCTDCTGMLGLAISESDEGEGGRLSLDASSTLDFTTVELAVVIDLLFLDCFGSQKDGKVFTSAHSYDQT